MRRRLIVLLALFVPACTPGEAADQAPAETAEAAVAEAPVQESLVDPNLAEADQLADLGLSDEAASALVAGRPFADMLQVDAVLGEFMDAEAREALYGEMFLRLDLNAASRDEILLVPGVGNRMAREFLEYRPYTEIAEFRREIGKYVDDEEVARLEKYVRVP